MQNGSMNIFMQNSRKIRRIVVNDLTIVSNGSVANNEIKHCIAREEPFI